MPPSSIASTTTAMRHLSIALCLLLASGMPCLAADDAGGGLYQVGQFPEQRVDADQDGVADIDDNCPATQPTLLVRGQHRETKVDLCGCPIDPCTVDADKDGINDCDDQCLGTARGLKVGSTGCPLPQSRPQTFVLDVKFKFAEANLQEQYVPDLDQLRALMLRLPELKVVLEGHTDHVGSEEYNQALSQARADKCRKYLLGDSRIAPSRVKALGYGETRPVADNGSDEGRAKNRRTVVNLDYLYEFTPPNAGEALPR